MLRIVMIKRIIHADAFSKNSTFLWGPRQTGKSTLLRQLFPLASYYDLLLASEFRRLSARPGLLAEECRALGSNPDSPIIIDEIQKIPELLDEVHSLISRHGYRFILTGSSPRKIMREGGQLLGGRARRMHLLPLTTAEIPHFSLERALNHGLLPSHYLADDPLERLTAYVGDYLREEILAEALTRNLPAFQRFLDAAAFSNGQMTNAASIAREIGISANTVRGYFDILTDTLIASWLPAWRKRPKRRVIEAPRFYFFDVGLVNELSRRGPLRAGSAEFGAAFEHFIFMELTAHSSYLGGNYPLAYWRTTSGLEVDLIIGDGHTALEIKSTEHPTSDHLKGLRAYREDYQPKQSILVCRAPRPRVTEDDIKILPWQTFLSHLWSGELKVA
jgi:uncharacterized protein